jgi:hypothetical protein
MLSDPKTRILSRLWNKAYDDAARWRACRTLQAGEAQPKEHANVAITQREIGHLLLCTSTDFSVTGMLSDNPLRIARHIAIVPVNPTEVLSLANAALVSDTLKRQLFRAFKLGGLEGYTKSILQAEKNSKSVFIPSQEQIQLMQPLTNSSLAGGCTSDPSSGGKSEVCGAEGDCLGSVI